MSRYQDAYRGCLVTVVTERIDSSDGAPLRRIKSVLVTRSGQKLDYEAPPQAGSVEGDIVRQAFGQAIEFLKRNA
jgi:hypothetical protein